MTNSEKNQLNFNDLVSSTGNKVLETNLEKEIREKTKSKEAVFSDTFITSKQDTPDILTELFFGDKHDSKTGEKLKIMGLEDQSKISEQIQELKPISEIFSLARDMQARAKRSSLKDSFYIKEEINVNNNLLISRALFLSTCITFVLMALLFAVFKNRMIMLGAVLTMAGTILSGLLFFNRKEKTNEFLEKKFKLLEEDIKEIKIRLQKIKEDTTYFQAIRLAEKIPSFEIEFSTKVNHVMDLITEYESINKTDYEKKHYYYDGIMKNLEEVTKYEKETYDKYFTDKLKKV